MHDSSELNGQSQDSWFRSELQQRIFLDRYALKDPNGIPIESMPEEMWRRVAAGIAAVESTEERRTYWAQRFHDAMRGFRFVPAGRILAGAGSGHAVTFFNCFVLPSPEDSRGGILDNLKLAVEIMARGGVLRAGLKAGMLARMFEVKEAGSKGEPHADRHGVD